MSLTVGDLVAYLGLDDSKFEKGIAGAKKTFSKTGDWLKEHGKEIGLTAGAAMAVGIGTGIEQQRVNKMLAARLGLSGKQAEKVGKVAGDLWTQGFGESMDDAGDAVKAVVQQLGVKAGSKMLEPLSKSALQLSKLMDEDVGPAAAAVGTLIKTGLVKNGKQGFDLLTRGYQLGADKAEDLLDTMTEYPTTFRQLGISGKDAMGLIVQGLKAGARNSDQVADAIKEFSIRAIDGSKTTRQGFKLLGLDAGKMREAIAKGGPTARKAFGIVLDSLRKIKDPAKRQAAAVDLFGTKAEDMGRALEHMNLSNASKQIGKVEGATKKAGATMADTAEHKVTKLRRQFQSLLAKVTQLPGPIGDIGAGVTAFGKDVLDALGPVGSMVVATRAARLAKMAEAEAQTAETTATRVGTLTRIRQTTATVAGKVASLAAAGATKTMAVAQRALNLAMKANPIGLLITVIAALVTGIIIAYKHSETFRRIVHAALHVVGEAGKWLWNNALKPAFHAIEKGFNAIKDAVHFLWNKVLRPIFKLWVDVWFTVVGAIVHGAAKAFGWVPGLGGKLKGAAKAFDHFKNMVNRALDGVHDEDVNITARVHGLKAVTAARIKMQGKHPTGLAAGGPVRGPGTGTSDDVPLMGSNGEHMWTAREVRAAGGHAAVAAIRRGVLHRAEGGPVTFDVHARTGKATAAFRQGAAALQAVMHGTALAIRNAMDGLTKVLGFPGGNGAAPTSANAKLGRQLLNARGWGAYWPAFNALVMSESGWRNTAQNPTSTAYGIGQFLDSTWASVGGHKTSNPRLQIEYMLRYIANRYGNPANAWAFKRAHNWYDNGGWLMPGATLAVNGTGQPERVVSPAQSDALEAELAELIAVTRDQTEALQRAIDRQPVRSRELARAGRGRS